jgi:hypothetical protein
VNIESYATINENAKIQGVALIPRISRNNNLYTKEELARFHGKKVPLNWEHNGDKVIGEVTFQYDPTSETVYYEGVITDPSAALLAKNKLLYTSIEATPTTVKQVCNGGNDCFHMPFGLVPEALALTETPGVPETSVNVFKESILQTISKCKEHTEADHEFVHKYGASEIIHKTIKPREAAIDGAEKSADNIMQDKFGQMAQSLEAQIKQKEQALDLFKKIAQENNDPIVSTQVEMIENDIMVLTNQLIGLRKDSEFISVEHTLEHIVNNLKEKLICDCCGDLKKNENK